MEMYHIPSRGERIFNYVSLGLCSCTVLYSAALIFDLKSYFRGDHVVPVTKRDWKDHMNDGKVHFVKFFSRSRDGSSLEPDEVWEDLARGVKSNREVSIDSINCFTNRKVCKKFQIAMYPSIIPFYRGKPYLEPYEGDYKTSDLREYVESIHDAIKHTEEFAPESFEED